MKKDEMQNWLGEMKNYPIEQHKPFSLLLEISLFERKSAIMFHLKNKPVHLDYHKYPSTDGEPMAVSTLHFEWLVTIKENLEILTQEKDIFVAGDLLWYPVKGRIDICKAPDVMVAIGRPKGERLSYLQWLEEGVAPQCSSPKN